MGKTIKEKQDFTYGGDTVNIGKNKADCYGAVEARVPGDGEVVPDAYLSGVRGVEQSAEKAAVDVVRMIGGNA
jgi:hypothetical protein